MTVSGLIHQALMLMGDVRPGYTASTDVLNTALETANAMLASWSTEGNMVPSVSLDSVSTIGSGTVAYTWGSGGTINAARPLKILAAKVIANNIPQPVEILTRAEDYIARADDDTAVSNWAEILFCNYALPTSTVLFWPAPASGGSIQIYSLKPLTAFAALGDTISMHSGYEHAITYNLAVLLAPKLGRQVPEYIGAIAAQAKAGLARLNEEVLRAWMPEEVAQ